MREIKFRGWDKENKLMVYPNFPTSSMSGGLTSADILSRWNPEWIMQYTGLKANGKEIYEGDIIEIFIPATETPSIKENHLVSFRHGGFVDNDNILVSVFFIIIGVM